MKIRNIIVISAAVAVLWFAIALAPAEPEFVEPLRPCDVTEESRLRIVLKECSDAVMMCTWGAEETEEENGK